MQYLYSFTLAKTSPDFVAGKGDMRKPESQPTEYQQSTPRIKVGTQVWGNYKPSLELTHLSIQLKNQENNYKHTKQLFYKAHFCTAQGKIR